MEQIELMLAWIFFLMAGWVFKRYDVKIVSSVIGLYLAFNLLATDFVFGVGVFSLSLIQLFEAIT